MVWEGFRSSAIEMQASAIPTSLVTNESEKPIIVLDAGHGGIDGGCTSADGIPEKGINLNILLCLRDLLEVSGFDVQVTRDCDKSIHDEGIEGIAAQKSSDMDNRLALFNKNTNADLYFYPPEPVYRLKIQRRTDVLRKHQQKE